MENLVLQRFSSCVTVILCNLQEPRTATGSDCVPKPLRRGETWRYKRGRCGKVWEVLKCSFDSASPLYFRLQSAGQQAQTEPHISAPACKSSPRLLRSIFTKCFKNPFSSQYCKSPLASFLGHLQTALTQSKLTNRAQRRLRNTPPVAWRPLIPCTKSSAPLPLKKKKSFFLHCFFLHNLANIFFTLKNAPASS